MDKKNVINFEDVKNAKDLEKELEKIPEDVMTREKLDPSNKNDELKLRNIAPNLGNAQQFATAILTHGDLDKDDTEEKINTVANKYSTDGSMNLKQCSKGLLKLKVEITENNVIFEMGGEETVPIETFKKFAKRLLDEA